MASKVQDETESQIEAPPLDGPPTAPDSTESTKSANGSAAVAVLKVGAFSRSSLNRGAFSWKKP